MILTIDSIICQNKIMFENPDEEDNLQKKMRKYIFKVYSNNKIVRKMEKIRIPGRLTINIKRMIHPRISNTKYDFKKLERKENENTICNI